MSLENRFVALPEANTSRIRTAVRLPYGVENKVGLDLRLIEQLAQIGGIATIRFSIGHLEQDSPQIIGITSSGQALGGVSRMASQPYDLENVTPNMAPGPDTWSHLEVKLDSQAGCDWIESRGKPLQKPQSWADLINQGLKVGLLKSGIDNLVNRQGIDWATTLFGVSVMAQNLLNGNHIDFIINYTGWKLIYESLSLPLEGFEQKASGRRLSLMIFDGPEVDRMAMLLLGLATNRLAQSVEHS